MILLREIIALVRSLTEHLENAISPKSKTAESHSPSNDERMRFYE